MRVWYNARKWQIGTFETEELAQLAHQIAKDILKPENTPADSAAVEWNVKIARDAAIDGVKLAARDAEEGREGGVGLLESPKATQNYLLGGHIVSAGEQTIKHRLFSTATATRTSTILAHFTVTCRMDLSMLMLQLMTPYLIFVARSLTNLTPSSLMMVIAISISRLIRT